MPGLSLRTGLGGGAAVGVTGNGPPSSVAQQAYGPTATASSGTSRASALSPTRPFGLSLWVSVAAVVGLVVIRHSLPR